MVDPFIALVVGLTIGAVSGALSAFLGWNKTNEPFDVKKFISGLVTGIIAGIVVVMANTAAFTQAADQTALLISYVTAVVAIIGVDSVRTAITGAATKGE